jgi:hypothetical protein
VAAARWHPASEVGWVGQPGRTSCTGTCSCVDERGKKRRLPLHLRGRLEDGDSPSFGLQSGTVEPRGDERGVKDHRKDHQIRADRGQPRRDRRERWRVEAGARIPSSLQAHLSHAPLTSTLQRSHWASAGERPDGAVHGVAKGFLARIVEHVEAHVVHRVGEAEPCVGVGETKRAAGARRTEGALA